MELTDTHYYDGKINTEVEYMRKDIIRASSIPFTDKISNLNILRKQLRQSSLFCFDTIMRSYITFLDSKQSPNYDAINNMFAHDLLWLVCEKIIVLNESDYLILLEEQLEDMTTGLCPVGRTVRLFSLLRN